MCRCIACNKPLTYEIYIEKEDNKPEDLCSRCFNIASSAFYSTYTDDDKVDHSIKRNISRIPDIVFTTWSGLSEIDDSFYIKNQPFNSIQEAIDQ